ncbi:hypothetical protein HOLleu_41270 [Holothuria leucospilota]|uniref:Uncharacterized protein n=1 Tax=Holothuria leucospilota TaxID=206669 RepID=A0A9Q0YDR3_HOLLE|nr:hypothetical protein HOLleu_41270 [Holothuria leucospilota]
MKIDAFFVVLLFWQATVTTFGSDTCPPGVDRVNCFVSPCLFATCPAYPGATCVANYCGGCFAEWYQSGVLVNCLIQI